MCLHVIFLSDKFDFDLHKFLKLERKFHFEVNFFNVELYRVLARNLKINKDLRGQLNKEKGPNEL